MSVIRSLMQADVSWIKAQRASPHRDPRLSRSNGFLRAAKERFLDRFGQNGAHRNARAGIRSINLALQGGGAHGAFTWGVLDRLLEDGRLRFDGISGTSAGAVNAVALAAGLTEGGPEGARTKLKEIWQAVSTFARYSPLQPHPLDLRSPTQNRDWSSNHVFFDLMTRLVSPYQFNPLDFNPLRTVLEHSIDFKRLRRESPVLLHIAATDVASGRARIFHIHEITADAVLASACLPHLHQAVKVGRRHYWDGGYSANPPILPLVAGCGAADTLIVQINPGSEPELPTDAQEIFRRLNRITFNVPLRREIELIERCRTLAADGFAIGGQLRRRIKRHRFHHIEAAKYTRGLGHSSKLHPDWNLLCHLCDGGRAAADTWLKKHIAAIGRDSTIDLAKIL